MQGRAEPPMRIVVFGASRGVGRATVEAGIAAGHEVTAFARSAGTLAGSGAQTIAADVRDPAAVAAALASCDAVIVALGVTPGSGKATPATICSAGTATIVAEMRRAAIERLVVVTSYGVGLTRTRQPFPFNLIAATVLRSIMADKEQQESDVRASGLRWTIVQPLGLTDGPAMGGPYVSIDGSRQSSRIARADVAAVCIAAVEQGTFVGESVAVSAEA